MKFNKIIIQIENKPPLDRDFIPLFAFSSSYLKNATKPLCIAIERNNGFISTYNTHIYGTPEMTEADSQYVERTVKFLLWARGGYKIFICGDEYVAAKIKSVYSDAGSRGFDAEFMEYIYEKAFEVISLPYDKRPSDNESPQKIGRHLDGCRIGFDAGGSDRKVSAVIDGETVFSEEVVWYPKIKENYEYHYEEILSAFRKAASKMPHVDAIGISSAGIFIDNLAVSSTIFNKIPKPYPKEVRELYIRAAKEIGDVPVVVANDGDVSALAGSMSLGCGRIMGLAMGTSEAAGYIDADGNIAGWLNELAFAPVDIGPQAGIDEWSGDFGIGSQYFSQDAVIRLAQVAGIELEEGIPPAQKLKYVQMLMEKDDLRARKVYESIGCYLGHTIPLYKQFYDLQHVLLLGRVMSGKGGDLILEICNKVLIQEYPDIACEVKVVLPDEKFRRVGQSMAAASLPNINR